MKKGQKNEYEKSYFQPLNNQDFKWFMNPKNKSKDKNIARKAKRKK